MPILRSTAVAAAAATAVVLTPALASAAALTHYDASGDVLRYTVDTETQEETFEPAPERTQGDIAKAKVSFTGDTVRVSATFRGLAKGGFAHIHSVRLVTSKVERWVQVYALSGLWAGQHEFTKKDGDSLPCAGVRHAIDYTAKVVTVTVPRSCLTVSGVKPGAVQAGFGTQIITGDETAQTDYVDDAFRPTPVEANANLTLSPRVLRTA